MAVASTQIIQVVFEFSSPKPSPPGHPGGNRVRVLCYKGVDANAAFAVQMAVREMQSKLEMAGINIPAESINWEETPIS